MAGEQRAIAQALNLSEATVSRSLKNNPRISAATRARVAEAAVRMGFRSQDKGDLKKAAPDRPRSSGLVHLGVLCRGSLEPTNVHNAVTMRLIGGMSGAARSGRAAIHVEYLSPDEFDRLDDPAHWPPVLKEHVVSGLAVFSDISPDALTALARQFACVRFVDNPIPALAGPNPPAIDTITEDNIDSVRQLIDHLWSLGHRKFGMADFGYTVPSARARLTGYLQSLVERQIEYDPQNVRYIADYNIDGETHIRQVARHIADLSARGVRAWICPDDYLGYRLIESLAELKVQVPRDVSLCGFDNCAPPRGLPKLTSIDGQFETMGAAAATHLISRIVTPSTDSVHMMFRCRLIEGASTAPPKR